MIFGIEIGVLMWASTGVATAVWCLAIARQAHLTPAPTVAARRALHRASAVGALAGIPVVVAVVLAGYGTPVLGAPVMLLSTRLDGHQLAVLPLAAVILTLIVTIIGESRWPRPTGNRRQARLRSRDVADVAPMADLRATLILVTAVVVVAAGFTLMASGARSVSRITSATTAQTASPFPGWLWSLPVVTAALLALLLSRLLLRLIATRPAIDNVDENWDMWLRRQGARRALRTLQLVLGLTVAGLVGVAGTGLVLVGSGAFVPGPEPGPGSVPHQAAGTIMMLLALAIAVATVVLALRPARDPAPASPPSRPEIEEAA